MIDLDADALLLTVPAQTAIEGSSLRRFHQRIDVPRSAVVEIEARRLMRRREGRDGAHDPGASHPVTLHDGTDS